MSIKMRLKVMGFLQFFIWGSWLVTFGSYMGSRLGFTGAEIGMVYGAIGIASLFMPSLMGIVADRWIPANRLYALLHFLGAIALFIAAYVTEPAMMFLVILFYSMVYMPTISLSNSISLFSLENVKLDTIKHFPGVRVFGTIGFIVAMWFVDIAGWKISNMQLMIAAIFSLILAVYAIIALPLNPISNSKKDESWACMFGLEAFVLFKQKRMFIFFIFAMLLGGTLQITNIFGSPFLSDFGNNPAYADSIVVKHSSVLLSVSQISEVFFILAIPFFLSKFGIKRVMLISMIAWAVRFALFAYGDPTPFGIVLLLLSMIVYGCAFDFFNISGAIFVEKEVDNRIRASAQGLFMTMVNGIGAYFGAVLSGLVVDMYTVDGIKDWHSIWLVFTAYNVILALVFVFTFNDKKTNDQRSVTTQ